VDFRNVIIIMTTNAGAADLVRPAYGFTHSKREGDDTEAINKLFAPEFRNRLDAIISFGHLPKEVVQKVVDKFVLQLEAQLADRNVTIELTDEARDWLVEHGYDEAMGARPMARLIQTTIKTPLADDVLFGRLKTGGAVKVIVKTDDIGLQSLGFEYPEGPATPKPEKDVRNVAKKRSKPKARSYSKAQKPSKPKGPGGSGGGGIRTVPKVPLVRA
jgi:ATP-dependent Clp protease ATP-binding subunit ClpA